MSEPKFDLTGDESDRDIEPRSRPSTVPEDHLQTTRLPAISPPPVGLFSSAPPPPMSAFSSSPPSAVVAVAPRVPSFDPSTGESAAPPSTMSDAPAGRSSWWRGLLTATFPPPRDAVSADDRVLRKRIGSIAAGVAAALVIVALVAGLRPAPSGEAAVAATVVASRAAVALGLLAFAYALLRAAERLFFPPADTQATDSQEPGRSRGEPTKPGTPPH